MSRTVRVALLGLCLFGAFQVFSMPLQAAAPPAAKTEQAGSSHEMLFETINFILLAGLFVYFYRKRGRAFFDERSELIQRNLDEGRQTLEASQARLADAEKKLAGLQDEIRALRQQAEADIESEREKMRRAADDEARRMEDFAHARILAATNAAKLELKDYAVEQALDQARGMIEQRMDKTNREKLLSFFLADLGSETKSN